MPSRAEKEAMREEREREKAERELYASPRTSSYKDHTAGLIRLGVMGVAALAIGGAVAMGAFNAPPSDTPLGADTAAQNTYQPATQQMAANDPALSAPPPMGPAAATSAPAKPAPRAAPRATAAPAEAPVPAPLAEQAPPIDVDPSTPEVMPAPPEMTAPPAQ